MKPNYLLTESLIGSVAIYMILRRVMTDFSDWDAHKLGIIDKDGKKLRHPVSSKEREAWDILTRFCWNIKKISTKFIGKSKFATYFSAAYLLADSINLFYIENNKEKLNETLLRDISYTKQLYLHNALKQINVGTKVTEENLEMMMFKHITEIEKVLNDNPEIRLMFEDGEAPAINTGGGTVASDIAGFAGRLKQGPTTKMKKIKAKKEKKDLSDIGTILKQKKKKRMVSNEDN
jgi:hypothetical protein